MYRIITIPELRLASYDTALMTGVLLGLFLLFVTERYAANPVPASALTGIKLFICYIFSVALLVQSACWFHYFFDVLRSGDRIRVDSVTQIIFTNPLRTERVLYGAIYMFPVTMFLSALFMGRPYLNFLDIKTPLLFCVLCFARLGCFLNGCCFGIVSQTFGMVFPSNSAVAVQHFKRGLIQGSFMRTAPSLPVIPTQLISMFFLLCFVIFSFLEIRKKRKYIFWRYLSYYAIFRFLIEFIRDDYTRGFFGLFSASQWLSLFILAPSVLLFFLKKEWFKKILKG